MKSVSRDATCCALGAPECRNRWIRVKDREFLQLAHFFTVEFHRHVESCHSLCAPGLSVRELVLPTSQCLNDLKRARPRRLSFSDLASWELHCDPVTSTKRVSRVPLCQTIASPSEFLCDNLASFLHGQGIGPFFGVNFCDFQYSCILIPLQQKGVPSVPNWSDFPTKYEFCWRLSKFWSGRSELNEEIVDSGLEGSCLGAKTFYSAF